MTPPVVGAFFALSVADLEGSRRWYARIFDLQTVLEVPPSQGTAVVVLEGRGLIVELLQGSGNPATGTAPGITKVGIIVPDFERALARLRARQVEVAFGPYPARGGQRANVIIRDNSGNLVQLFGPRPAGGP